MNEPRLHDRRSRRAGLALAILRLYPPVWRRRYGAELRALIDDHGVRGRDLLDLGWGALRERWRGPNGPDPLERPLAAARWRGWTWFFQYQAIGLGLGAASYGAGWILSLATGPLWEPVGTWLLGTAVIVLMFICLNALVRTYQATRLLPALPPAPTTPFARQFFLTTAGFFLLTTALIGAAHEAPKWTFLLDYLWLASLPALSTSSAGVQGQRLAQATRQYFGSHERLKHARVELQRLESLSLPETAPDMGRQRAEIDRLETEMAAALEILRHPDRIDSVDAGR